MGTCCVYHDELIYVQCKTYILLHFLSKILTRYYWRKSRSQQGIRLTRVSAKWSRINRVDAAFEVPQENAAYLFEGDTHWALVDYSIH